jgi:hypothetical protein
MATLSKGEAASVDDLADTTDATPGKETETEPNGAASKGAASRKAPHLPNLSRIPIISYRFAFVNTFDHNI